KSGAKNNEKAHRHCPSHAGRRHAVARWPEEDPRNGFTHGGWVMPFWDDALNQTIGETIAGQFDMLLGRRTYEIFAAYWPHQGDNAIAKAFNKATKYVVTRTLDQFDWENSLADSGWCRGRARPARGRRVA